MHRRHRPLQDPHSPTTIKSRESSSNINRAKVEETNTSKSQFEYDDITDPFTEPLAVVNINEEKTQLIEDETSMPENGSKGQTSQHTKRKESASGLNWTGAKKSQKLQLKETDDQINQAMQRFDRSIELLQQQSKQPDVHGMDEESLFCLSLAPRLRRLDPQKKAIARNSIEILFFNIEYGNSVAPEACFSLASDS